MDEREWMDVANRNALERERFADLLSKALAALEDIAEPMKKIHSDAKAQGLRVDGVMANALCQDANWLRDKARAALREIDA